VTRSDLAKFSDKKHRAASLRQLSFLSCILRTSLFELQWHGTGLCMSG